MKNDRTSLELPDLFVCGFIWGGPQDAADRANGKLNLQNFLAGFEKSEFENISLTQNSNKHLQIFGNFFVSTAENLLIANFVTQTFWRESENFLASSAKKCALPPKSTLN